MTPRTDFAVKTAAGATIGTFDNRKRAVEEAERLAERFPGLRVVSVTYTAPQERTVWTTARLRLVEAAGA